MSRSNHLHLSLDEVSAKLDGLKADSQPYVYLEQAQETENSPLLLRFMHKPSRQHLDDVDRGAEAEQNSRRNLMITDEGLHIRHELRHELQHQPPHGDLTDPTTDAPLLKTLLAESIGYRLVRKKSGEILKPSLKDLLSYFTHHAATKSLPTTPTYKLVHFGASSDVRYFKKKDRPATISVSNSPTTLPDFRLRYDDRDDDSDDRYDSDDTTDAEDYRRFAYADDDDDFYSFNLNSSGSTNYPNPKHKKLIDWRLELVNFPKLSYDYKIKFEAAPIFLERIFISIDKKFLLGHLAVRNISFEKTVTVRYTLDNWLTIIEIPTIYVPDVPSVLKQNNYDRFIFKIPLNNLFNSFRMNTDALHVQENEYDFCFKYNANNTEFWDNNNYKNYKIKLIKVIENKDPPPSEHEAVPIRKSNSFTSFDLKISNHRAKPRYSSNYLKRRLSDTSLAKKGPVVGSPANNTLDSLSDFSSNDFIKNNYYLSLPLLSSLKNQDTDVMSQSNVSNENLINRHSDDCEDELTVKPDFDYNSKNFFNNNTINSESYKELLDTYCFFNTNDRASGASGWNSGKENAPMSTPEESASPDDAYTVSSLLGVNHESL